MTIPIAAAWEIRRLWELPLQIIDGDRSAKYPKRSEFRDSGVLFLNTTNIVNDRLDLSGAVFITEEKFAEIQKGRARRRDILMTTRGSIGKVALFDCEYDEALINAQILILRADDAQLDSRFLFYAVRSPLFKTHVANFASGVAQPQIPIADLREVEIPVPALPAQRRIAGILSAYDELIENNQRRIQILETMARALYREWFVEFRFPGHDKIPRVASPLGDIPQGWEVTTLGTQLNLLESGKRPKGGIRNVEDGVPSIGAENINGIGRHDFASEKYIPREFFQEMRKGVVRDRDVAIYKDGAYIGKSSYFRDGFPHAECCVNEHVFLLHTDGIRFTQNALYLWLQEPDTVHAIRAKNANAAQPGINQQSVGSLKLVLSDEKTATQFDRLVEPLLAEIINLARRIENLRRTRDLLLPRLLSGQVTLADTAA